MEIRTRMQSALFEHELPKFYQSRTLMYLLRNASSLKTRSNHEIPVRMETHEYFNLRTYNAVKIIIDEKLKEKDVPVETAPLYDPLNTLFMSIGCGEYDFIFTDAINPNCLIHYSPHICISLGFSINSLCPAVYDSEFLNLCKMNFLHHVT